MAVPPASKAILLPPPMVEAGSQRSGHMDHCPPPEHLTHGHLSNNKASPAPEMTCLIFYGIPSLLFLQLSRGRGHFPSKIQSQNQVFTWFLLILEKP